MLSNATPAELQSLVDVIAAAAAVISSGEAPREFRLLACNSLFLKMTGRATMLRDALPIVGDTLPRYARAPFGDALHDFPADEILIITAPHRPSTWLHQNAVDRARRSFQQPIEHLVIPATPVRRSP